MLRLRPLCHLAQSGPSRDPVFRLATLTLMTTTHPMGPLCPPGVPHHSDRRREQLGPLQLRLLQARWPLSSLRHQTPSGFLLLLLQWRQLGRHSLPQQRRLPPQCVRLVRPEASPQLVLSFLEVGVRDMPEQD